VRAAAVKKLANQAVLAEIARTESKEDARKAAVEAMPV